MPDEGGAALTPGMKRKAPDGAPLQLGKVAKAAVAKAPVSKAPVSKAPVSKAPVAKAPLSKAPVAKAPVAKALPSQAPSSKAPVAKSVPSKAPGAGGTPLPKGSVQKAAPAKVAALAGAAPKGSVAKAIGQKAPAPVVLTKATSKAKAPSAEPPAPSGPSQVPAIPPKSPTEEGQKEEGPKRLDSWKEFSDVDPLYALMGELGEKTIFDEQQNLREELLRDYVERLCRNGVTTKNKDWVEVWAAMSIPVDKQDLVVQVILEIGLESEVAETVPDILVELVKGHRVKVKMIEEAVATLFECGSDQHSCLQRFLLNIFPKSPTSEWGWSRVGWSWQQWWGTAERILNALDGHGAFECLVLLLTAIETQSGAYLPHQQIWDEGRLAKVRAALCKYGNLSEDQLAETVEIVLS